MTKETGSQHKKIKKHGLFNIIRAVLISAVILSAAGATGHWFYIYSLNHESTDNAFVEGHVSSVAPRISGHVLKVMATDNQKLKKGAVLATIDPADYKVALEIAQALLESAQAAEKEADAKLLVAQKELRQRQAELVSEQAGLSKIKAQVKASRAGYLRDKKDLNRLQNILTAGAVSRQEYDHAAAQEELTHAELTSAQSEMETQISEIKQAEAALEVAGGNLMKAQAQIKISQAKERQALAEVEQARLNLSYTTIVAPCSGYVTKKAVEPGNYISVGQKILSIVSPEVWIVANFKETQIMPMIPGLPVDITVDSFPEVTFKGHVDSIQHGTGSRFTLLPPENASGNFIKVVQRVPVKITIDKSAENQGYTLSPGMSVVPVVDVSSVRKAGTAFAAILGKQE